MQLGELVRRGFRAINLSILSVISNIRRKIFFFSTNYDF